MSEPAIRVEYLGKMYRIGGPVERYRTFRDTVAQGFARAGRRVRSWFGGGDGAAPKYETIWALKDVSFEIQPGEVVGVIGRNGAGKSTLLKILSRITEPTEGRAVVRGRVGSLLEVGTGFHPELTGRENVYLNGAILGMKRAEVDRKFDEIVAFAEIEKFIDTPVKHYSSGMYLRLAFAVAAHLTTDILLVDEVLAVGDAHFQKKCLGKMDEISQCGRTVLFVSHNLATMLHLCPHSLLLEGGKLMAAGKTGRVLGTYGELIRCNEAIPSSDDVWGPVQVETTPKDGQNASGFNGIIGISATLRPPMSLRRAQLIAIVEDAFGRTFVNRRIEVHNPREELAAGHWWQVHFRFRETWPLPGVYSASFKLIGIDDDEQAVRYVSDRATFEVTGESTDLGKSVIAPPYDVNIVRLPS